MTNSLVSILLPVYNGERFLFKAIESVLSQTYVNFELLIYNDGSTDNTIRIINSFGDNRIKLFGSDNNQGIVFALNFLITKSKGEFIARIDADDIWYPNKLKKQIIFFEENQSYGMVACFVRLIDKNGDCFPSNFKQYYEQKDILKILPYSDFIIHSSVMIKKDVFDIVGKYSNKYLHTEDYELWLRFMENNILFSVIPEKLLDYRISNYNINFRFRKQQSRNVIRLKLGYYKRNGFKLIYLKGLLKNLYYLFTPNVILLLKIKKINRRLKNNDGQ